MKKKTEQKAKLVLNRKTVRDLSGSELLKQVVGGSTGDSQTCPDNNM
jgi:hypothetical protein